MIPSININFTALANTFVDRSYTGLVSLIVYSDQVTTPTLKEYLSLEELAVDVNNYSEDTYSQLTKAFDYDVTTLKVIQTPLVADAEDTELDYSADEFEDNEELDYSNIELEDDEDLDNADTSQDLTETPAPVEIYDLASALVLLKRKVVGGVVSLLDGSPDDYVQLADFAVENTDNFYTTVVFDTKADSKFVVNYTGDKVTYNDDTEVDAIKYLSSVCAVISVCSGQRACTYFTCSNISSVTESNENVTAVEAGEFRLFNDYDKVRVLSGVNSLQTLAEGESDDMKFIDIVDTMNLIKYDISHTFKENYIGQVRNNYDNQMMFVSYVNDYFAGLAENQLLDNEFENISYIDVDSQRAELIKKIPDAKDWTDVEVKKYSVGRKLFLSADIKILGAMEQLTLNITMN